MKIKLYNGIELNPIMVTGAHKFYQGANRDCLTFVFPEMSLDELDENFSEANCEVITIYTEENTEDGDKIEIENLHFGYVIKNEIVKKDVVIREAEGNNEAITEKRCFVTMAQRTYAESQIASLTETVDILVLESLMA